MHYLDLILVFLLSQLNIVELAMKSQKGSKLKKVDMKTPRMIEMYNENIGGVDKVK